MKNHALTIKKSMENILKDKASYNKDLVYGRLQAYDSYLMDARSDISEAMITRLVELYLDICEAYSFKLTQFITFNELYGEVQI